MWLSSTLQENGLDDQLWQISMHAGQWEKQEVGRYFETVDPYKAITLYQKAGNYHRALHLAFRSVYLFDITFMSRE